METKSWEGMGGTHSMNLSIFGNARIEELFKDFVSFASTNKCKRLSNKREPKSPRRQRCFVFPHQALRQQIPSTKNSKNYYYNPHTWWQWNAKHVIDVTIWMNPRTHFNLSYKGRNQNTIPITTLLNTNETQNMLSMLQFGWTQEPISTCVIKMLAYYNGRKSTCEWFLQQEEKMWVGALAITT